MIVWMMQTMLSAQRIDFLTCTLTAAKVIVIETNRASWSMEYTVVYSGHGSTSVAPGQ